MIGQGRPTIWPWFAAVVWLAHAHMLCAQDVRTPHESLRVVISRESLIFAPGETFTFDLEPLLEGVEPSTTIDIATTLTPARGRTTLWNTQQRLPVPVDGPPVATLHVPLPRAEGAYEIRLAVTRPPGFRQRFFPGGAAAPLVERSFQVVVLDRVAAAPAGDAPWRTVLEIDPANPTWSTRIPDWTQIRRLPGVPRRPIGSVHVTTIADPLGTFVELPPTPPAAEPHWQAYPLTLEAIGAPHLLEIEYPNDREQHLGISIVEPVAEGRFDTIGRDSGVYVEGLGATTPAEKHVHRLVFWPRTNSPLVLVTNQHPTAAARFGRLRVLRRSASSLATDPWAVSPPSGRLVAAYLARPWHNGAPSTSPADDWQSLWEGSLRMAEYLNYAGYNAAAVHVLAADGVILPHDVLQTAPELDIRPIGVEQDLPSTDGLELMLRVFDRSGLALLPALQLAVPLPQLEALRRGTDPQRSGIALVGPDGLTWHESHPTASHEAPRYNLLDDRVQRVMLETSRRIIERCAGHPSFAGLMVQLSGRSSAVLPDLDWGLDDATVAQFARDTGIRLPDDGPERFAARQKLLLGEHADAWRAWRAARVTRFYQQLAALVESSGGGRRLLLTTEELFTTPNVAAKVRPNVVAKTRLDRAMLDRGIDWPALERTPGVMILPTRYVESMVPLVDRAVDLAINDAFVTAEHPRAAALFYHRPQRHSFSSFGTLSPLSVQTQLVAQSSAHGAAARQPYVAALVDDDPAIVIDGGELPTLGNENAVRALRKTLAALPITAAVSTQREQNVTVRSYAEGGQTLCLVVNECPWDADVTLDVVAAAPADATPLVAASGTLDGALSNHFGAGRQLWALKLAPYDVHAVRFNAAGVRFENIQAQISEAGQQELAAKVSELNGRDLTATPRYSGLENPGCEPLAGAGALLGWELSGEPLEAKAELDATSPQEGQTCLYLQNRGQGEVVLQSNSFTTPPTGSLAMWVFVRGENLAPSSQLRLGFEVDGANGPYRQFATIGGDRPMSSAWGNGYAFRAEDLPLDSRGRMRVKFELVGPGEVWIDNVQLFDLLFPLKFYERSEPERYELFKLARAAEIALEDGRLADCIDLLNGYWPRFLNAYTPPKPGQVPTPPIATQPDAQDAPTTSTTKDEESESPSIGGWFRGLLTR